ncbi:hypothetical protein GGQ84_002985 [Desulfitispora alkaliphila]|uniref:hypothetical protein n=1 Tax=Desulfitispora alkaliphila TaxID=622674 RepID=UPI003D1B88D7
MDWINIKVIPENNHVTTNMIYLPKDIFKKLNRHITLEFGLKKVKAETKKIDKKGTIYVSPSLLEEACLITTQPYQIKVKEHSCNEFK